MMSPDVYAPDASLAAADPLVADMVARETARQAEGLELIASENFASPAVLAAAGTPLTNKYAEGYPGKRYYGGCEVVDEVEALAISRAKQLFGAGPRQRPAPQRFAGQLRRLPRGDAPRRSAPRHGVAPRRASHPRRRAERVGQDVPRGAVRACARKPGSSTTTRCATWRAPEKPKVIVCGGSAYGRIIDFPAFAAIAREVGALFMCDMAHFAGLVAGGAHPSPVPHADLVTTTTHKTLRGPRGGMILSTEQLGKAVDKEIFPGTQGGP